MLSLRRRRVQIGFSKTVLSRGKYAEIYQEARAHSDAEDALIEGAIHFAYNSFRDKAAQSRDMSAAAMEQHAQGRVWLGKHARTKGYAAATLTFVREAGCCSGRRTLACFRVHSSTTGL